MRPRPSPALVSIAGSSPRSGRRSPLLFERLEDRVNPGAGRFTAGVFDFCVSIRFNASDAEIAQIKTALTNASNVLADATDGQHKFGTISLLNNKTGSESADFWIHKGAGRADAPLNGYGVRGMHSNLFFTSNFMGGAADADGDSYTIAHEFAHLAYGIDDEYSGPMGDAENAPFPGKGKTEPTLSYSLMDNYFKRGGNFPDGAQLKYTLNEFSVASNHDPDGDTYQTATNKKKSDWETLAASRFPATAPAGLPVDAPPAAHTVTFNVATGNFQSMLVIDKSGSTSSDMRNEFAKLGGQLYTALIPDGNTLGLVSFDDAITLEFPLSKVDAGVRSAIISKIQALVPSGSTNITGGVQSALDQITKSARTCNEVIVLLTDGDHNVGPAPATLIPALKMAGVPVFAVGVGSGISTSGEQTLVNLAVGTGGRYFRFAGSFDQINFMLRLNQEAQGNALVGKSPQGALIASAPVGTDVLVEPGVNGVQFTATRENKADAVTFTLVSPSGQTFTTGSTGPNVQVVSDSNSDSIRITGPEAGTWRMSAVSAAATKGKVQTFAYADAPGTQVQVNVAVPTLTFPAPITVRAAPQFQGFNITGGTVTGTVTRPDGTTVALPLFDDGLPIHGDVRPGDGVFSNLFNDYTKNGTYNIDVAVNGTNAVIVGGDSALFPTEPENPIPVPAFTRVGTATAVVTGVSATITKADLGITLTGPAAPQTAGQKTTYTVQVTNKGPNDATGVVATFIFPGGLTFVASKASTGTATNNNGVVTFNVGALASGKSADLTVDVTAAMDGVFRVAGDVTSGTLDPNLDNNATSIPAPNTLPTITDLVDQKLGFNKGGTAPLAFTIGDSDTPADKLVVTFKTSNPAFVPVANVALGGTGKDRTITVTPVGGVIGSSVITVTVRDELGLTVSDTFTVSVPNTAPTLSDIANQMAVGGKPIPALPFTVGDVESPLDKLTVTVASDNQALIPDAALVLGGSAGSRTLTLAPAAGQTGTATIVVTVRDPDGLTAQDTFTVTITAPPNTQPTISDIQNGTFTVGQAISPIGFTIGDAETAADKLTVGIQTSNGTLLPLSGVVIGGAGTNRTLTLIPAAGQVGSATVTVTVTDAGGLFASDTFTLTVNALPVTAVGAAKEFAAGADRGSGTVTFFNPDKSVRFTVDPFPGFTGGVRTAAADFNQDGVADLVVGTGPGRATQVRILDGKTQAELFTIDPFEASFVGGVYVTAGDVNGDGTPELIISPDEGGGPRVRVFSGKAGFPQLADFFGIADPNFRGGARVATGDVNGDGVGDVVVAAGFLGGPRVATFDGKTLASGTPQVLFNDFFAFEQTLRNGVFIAAGDLDGDGKAEVIAGGGPGGGPRITAFSAKDLISSGGGTLTQVANFFGGDPNNRGGVRVVVKNLDNDARADLVVGAGAGAGSRVTGYLGKDIGSAGTPAAAFDFDAFPGFTGGIFVG